MSHLQPGAVPSVRVMDHLEEMRDQIEIEIHIPRLLSTW